MATPLILDPGLILPMTAQDVEANDFTPRMQKGQFTIIVDRFGVRYARYLRNRLASSLTTTAGGLYSRAAIVAIASSAAGSTTTGIVTTGLTADVLVDRLAYVKTDPTPGAAPEGEVGVITANSATLVTIDSRRPFTVAVATASAVDIYALYDFIKAASGDLNSNVMGVGLANAGVAYGNWGILQVHGLCPDVKCKADSAVTINKALIAHTEQVTVSSTSADNLLVGNAVVTGNSTNSGKILAWINVFSPDSLTA